VRLTVSVLALCWCVHLLVLM